jgi:hypothetical protein
MKHLTSVEGGLIDATTDAQLVPVKELPRAVLKVLHGRRPDRADANVCKEISQTLRPAYPKLTVGSSSLSLVVLDSQPYGGVMLGGYKFNGSHYSFSPQIHVNSAMGFSIWHLGIGM